VKRRDGWEVARDGSRGLLSLLSNRGMPGGSTPLGPTRCRRCVGQRDAGHNLGLPQSVTTFALLLPHRCAD